MVIALPTYTYKWATGRNESPEASFLKAFSLSKCNSAQLFSNSVYCLKITARLYSSTVTSKLKADSHSPRQSVFSTVDSINAEIVDSINADIENFLSLCGNATVHCGICTSVNKP